MTKVKLRSFKDCEKLIGKSVYFEYRNHGIIEGKVISYSKDGRKVFFLVQTKKYKGELGWRVEVNMHKLLTSK